MKFTYKFLEGGPMPAGAPEAAPAPEEQGGGDPMAQLVQGAMEAIQSNNCDIALQVCQMLVELAGGAQDGAPAPEEAAAPAPEEGEPVYAARGAKLLRRIRK